MNLRYYHLHNNRPIFNTSLGAGGQSTVGHIISKDPILPGTVERQWGKTLLVGADLTSPSDRVRVLCLMRTAQTQHTVCWWRQSLSVVRRYLIVDRGPTRIWVELASPPTALAYHSASKGDVKKSGKAFSLDVLKHS